MLGQFRYAIWTSIAFGKNSGEGDTMLYVEAIVMGVFAVLGRRAVIKFRAT